MRVRVGQGCVRFFHRSLFLSGIRLQLRGYFGRFNDAHPLFSGLFLLAACVPAQAAPPAAAQSILVLDASGSMWAQIDGQPKIAIAREAVAAMLADWSDGDLGLMAYGHRRKGDCSDIELLIEPAGFDAGPICHQVDMLNPKGIMLDPSAHAVMENHDFTTDQSAEDCRALCDAAASCAGWHYEPTGSYFIDHPRCHLKNGGFAVRLRQEGKGGAPGSSRV